MLTDVHIQKITPAEFGRVQQFLFRRTGIELKPGKEAMVMGRLDRRLRHHGFATFTEYLTLVESPSGAEEARAAIDLLTTNETYFFRESQHFDLLPTILPGAAQTGPRPIRIWSAASSTGEEAYTIALTLADCLGERPWEVVGTDISTRVLETARFGLYPLDEASKIPMKLLRAHCLKGRDEYEGLFTVTSALRARVKFEHANLTEDLPSSLGRFDVVFLRNVMIYFGAETKRQLLVRVLDHLRPGGYLLTGHAESITGLNDELKVIGPSVYHRPEG